LVQVRSRRWLVDEVIEPKISGQPRLVRLSCADDDAQGQSLDVLLDHELDRLILEDIVAVDKLKQRGILEERDLREALERQRDRVREELASHEGLFAQFTLDFGDEEKRQLESDRRAWRSRLEQFDRDFESEPQRVRAFYDVRAKRVEPVGLVYLWPETN
jgi:hypothetical protein